VSDLEAQLRPFTAEEWPAAFRAMSDAFGEPLSGPYQDRPHPLAELDRSLSLWDGDRIVATGGAYSLTMTVPGGGATPCAGVTWITVAPTHRRQGVLTAMMRRQLDELHERQREPVAALWAAEHPIYGRFGYAPASHRGGFSGAVPRLQVRPGADEGAGRVELVEAEEYRPHAAALHARLARSIPGTMARDDRWWDRLLRDDEDRREGRTRRMYLLHREADGEVTGYAAYRLKTTWDDTGEPQGVLHVEDVRALGTPGYAALWRFLLSLDLVRTMRWPMASSDDALRHLLVDARALHAQPVDALWVRLVDVDRALRARRYPTPIDLVLEVRDRFCPWNDGRWHLYGHPAGSFCERTDRDPDLVVDVEALAAAYLGGTSLATLQAAGRVTEVSPGAVTLASTAFGWPVAPWCLEEF
jgi:predicted acetyltransferase